MNKDELNKMIDEREGNLALAFPALMRKVYLWMALALAITGFTSYEVSTSVNLMLFIFEQEWHFYGLIIAEIALVWYLSARITRLSLSTATLLFALYAVLNGVTLSALFLVFTEESIAQVFFITAGTFGVMSLIGYTTKTDLTSLGKLLLMALIGLVIATVVNWFMNSTMLSTVISYIGVVLFVGLTAYDTQAIKRLLAQADDMDEEAQKISLLGALTLYLDFINLFIYLLRILGKKK